MHQALVKEEIYCVGNFECFLCHTESDLPWGRVGTISTRTLWHKGTQSPALKKKNTIERKSRLKAKQTCLQNHSKDRVSHVNLLVDGHSKEKRQWKGRGESNAKGELDREQVKGGERKVGGGCLRCPIMEEYHCTGSLHIGESRWTKVPWASANTWVWSRSVQSWRQSR